MVLLPTGRCITANRQGASPRLVIESLRYGGARDGQLRETRPLTGSLEQRTGVAGCVPAVGVAEDGGLIAGWRQGEPSPVYLLFSSSG